MDVVACSQLSYLIKLNERKGILAHIVVLVTTLDSQSDLSQSAKLAKFPIFDILMIAVT